MPQPANLVKLTMQFDLYGASGTPEDLAEFSVWGDTDPAPPADPDAWLLDLATFACNQWITGVPKTRFSPGVHLHRTLAGIYNTLDILTFEQAFVATDGDWSGAADNSLPWSNSIAISLYTYPRGSFVTQGRSKRGRIYLPPVAPTILFGGPSGEISIGEVNTLRDAVGDWLTAIVGHSGPGGGSFHPGVLSKTHNYFNELGFLSVDNKMDTQRRREKQQTATISTVAWP